MSLGGVKKLLVDCTGVRSRSHRNACGENEKAFMSCRSLCEQVRQPSHTKRNIKVPPISIKVPLNISKHTAGTYYTLSRKKKEIQ